MFCLGATLTQPHQRYPVEDFMDVYHARWGVEELYKISKNIFLSRKPDASGRAMRKIKTNFKNCLCVFVRHLEPLLILHAHRKQALERAFRFVVGRRQRVRLHRSYPRKSLKPPSKWRPSNKKQNNRTPHQVTVPAS